MGSGNTPSHGPSTSSSSSSSASTLPGITQYPKGLIITQEVGKVRVVTGKYGHHVGGKIPISKLVIPLQNCPTYRSVKNIIQFNADDFYVDDQGQVRNKETGQALEVWFHLDSRVCAKTTNVHALQATVRPIVGSLADNDPRKYARNVLKSR